MTTIRNSRYKSYTGVAYLFVTILISIWGNVLFQSYLFPMFPYPLFISLTSCIFPVLSILTASRKGYEPSIWGRYFRIAPLTLLNSLLSGILYNWSLLLTSMSAVTVITSSSTLFSLVFSRVLLGTEIKFQTVISIHLSIVGSILVISASNTPAALDAILGLPRFTTDAGEYSEHILGCVFAFLSSVCSGLSSVLFTKLQIRHTDAYMTATGTSAIFYTGIFIILNGIFKFESLEVLSNHSSGDVLSIILLNGIVSSVIGTQLYLKSLSRLTPVTVNVLWSLSIPLTVVVDYIQGTVHSVSSSFLLGALLVLLSTVLVPIEQQETSVADTTLEQDIPLLVIPDDSPSGSIGACNGDLEAHMLSSTSTQEMESQVRDSS
jgi:drug/metabolite transporter (DMT)-like permease